MKLARLSLLSVLLLPFVVRAASAPASSPQVTAALETVNARTIALLLGGDGDGPHRRAAVAANDAACAQYLAQAFEPVLPDPSANLPLNERLSALASRLRRVAIAYRSDIGEFHRSAAALERVTLGLDNILDHFNPRTPRPDNWYYWLIRLPDDLGAITLLLKNDLPPELLVRIRETLSHELTDLLLNGANAAWESRNHTYLALIENDPARIERAARHVLGTVRYGREGGVQEDYSYLFHGRIPYAGGYGAGFAQSVSQFIYLFDGTPWAASAERRDLMANYLLEHARWFMTAGKVDLLVSGRSYAGGNRGWTPLSEAMLLMSQVESARRPELLATAAGLLAARTDVDLSVAGIADRITPAADGLPTGFRYWPRAEIGVFRQRNFQIGFRQYSTRVQDYEYLTQNGATDWNLAYGFTHIMRSDGSGSWHEKNASTSSGGALRPEIDKEHLPGATTQIGGNPTNPPAPFSATGFSLNFGTSPFAGAAGWESSGVAGFILEPTYSAFVAKKSLHFFPTGFWALGSGISSASGAPGSRRPTGPVHTTVLQWPSASPEPELTLSGGRTLSVPTEETTLDDVRWLWIERLAVVFAEPTRVVVRRRGAVVTAWLDHGINPDGARYAFAVLPDAALAEAREFAETLPVRPVQHDERAHAVRDRTRSQDGIVFFEAGSCLGVTTNRPVILQRSFGPQGGVCTFQDPLHENARLALELDAPGETVTPDDTVVASEVGNGRIRVTADVQLGRIYRFGYGSAGRSATPERREDLSELHAFRVQVENDSAATILTVTLPPRALREGFELSVHGDRAHRLATLTAAEEIDRPAPDTIRYRWVRKPGKPNVLFPQTQQVSGDFRVFLQIGMTEAVEFFTVPFYDAEGRELPDFEYRRDLDNPNRPRVPWL